MDKPIMTPNEEYLYSRIVAKESELAALRLAVSGMADALGQISRMRTLPDLKANTFTLVAAHQLAQRTLTRHKDTIEKC